MTEIFIKRSSKKYLYLNTETTGSSGLDLTANIEGSISIEPGKISIIPTGISVSIPKNFEIQIRPRSGQQLKIKFQY